MKTIYFVTVPQRPDKIFNFGIDKEKAVSIAQRIYFANNSIKKVIVDKVILEDEKIMSSVEFFRLVR